MWTDRTEILLGKDGITKLENSHVAVVGIGGVGGYVCEMLARVGIGHMTLVDFDKIDETNINRQVVANIDTIGMNKTDVMKSKILKINPKCNVNVLNIRFCKENIPTFCTEKYDYVVDAIDSVQDKVELICCCKDKHFPIVSAMGAGNRIGIPNFKVLDIYKTSNDGLAKVMRRKLREREINSLDVVTSEEKPINLENQTKIGSISYQPAMCGCVISGFVVNKLLDKT